MSVAVVHRQVVILARGFGVVDLARGTAATEMSTYDPGYAQWCTELRTRNPPPARNDNCDSEPITVRHHLTHTAQAKPGTNYDDNGFLFARLTAVIDALSAKGFNRSIEEDILEPLVMRDTALGAIDAHKAGVVARMARPYKLGQDLNLVEPATVNPPFGYISAASGLIFDRHGSCQIRCRNRSRHRLQRTGRSSRSGQGEGSLWARLVRAGRTEAATVLALRLVWTRSRRSPDRALTLIPDRASSVFLLGKGDAQRSAFVTAFLDTFERNS